MHSCYDIEPSAEPPPTLVTVNPVRGACIRTSLPPTLLRDATVASFGVSVTRRPRIMVREPGVCGIYFNLRTFPEGEGIIFTHATIGLSKF